MSWMNSAKIPVELSNNRHVQQVRSTLVQHVLILGSIVAALWMLEMLDLLFWSGELDYYGIQPRTLSGLRNIFVSPVLHAGIGHLFTNTLPFLILGWFIMLRSTREFFFVSAVAVLISGLGIWIFGASDSVHLGISGVVFGYLGFLLSRGYFERSPIAIGLALIALFFYGGMIWGPLPLRDGVSWLGHLFGFIGGGLAAYYIISVRKRLQETSPVNLS
jgi:membrane associated rhomboid family serine protease